jgi:uncharacterized protein YegP (UPF0339 family)
MLNCAARTGRSLLRNVLLCLGVLLGLLALPSPAAAAPSSVAAAPASVSPSGAETVTISNGPGHTTDWVGLYAVGAANTSYLSWQYLSGTQSAPAKGKTSATLSFAMPSAPGQYNLRFLASNGYTLLATSNTITVAQAAGATITPSPTSVSPGGTETVAVSNGPGNTTDWVGLYAVGAANTAYLSWQYLSGTQSPPAKGKTSATLGFAMPSTPGQYNLRFLASNGYTLLAASNAVTVAPTASPVNGQCGSMNGAITNVAPTTDLCNVGTASAVTGTGPWDWSCAGTNGGTTASCSASPPGSGRHYLNGVYADPADTSTPALMGYPWDYTINGSYQDNYAGAGVSGLANLGGYPVIIDVYHIQSSYPDFTTAANGGYNTYYQETAQALAPYASQIYAVRIDSEFNGTWEASSPFAASPAIPPATWIAGFTNLATAIRQALPNAKIIWNPNIGQNNPFSYYPGDSVVDLIGPDMYCQPAYYSTSAACWSDYLNGSGGVNLTAFAAFGVQHNKPIVIPEWSDLFGDGYFITQMRTWMDDNNVVAHSYWDSEDTLESSAALPVLTTNQQAYVAAFGHRPYTGTYWPAVIPPTNYSP